MMPYKKYFWECTARFSFTAEKHCPKIWWRCPFSMYCFSSTLDLACMHFFACTHTHKEENSHFLSFIVPPLFSQLSNWWKPPSDGNRSRQRKMGEKATTANTFRTNHPRAHFCSNASCFMVVVFCVPLCLSSLSVATSHRHCSAGRSCCCRVLEEQDQSVTPWWREGRCVCVCTSSRPPSKSKEAHDHRPVVAINHRCCLTATATGAPRKDPFSSSSSSFRGPTQDGGAKGRKGL